MAIFLFLFFIFSLHPATGLIGGVYFTLTAWFIPSLINLLLSFWLANIIFKKPFYKLISLIFISIIFGLSLNLYLLIKKDNIDLTTKSEILKTIEYKEGVSVSTEIDKELKEIIVPSNFLISPIIVGSDEGCMCFYWSKAEELQEKIFKNFPFKIKPNLKNEVETVNIIMKKRNHYIDLIVEIRENNQILSWYKKEGILLTDISGRHGRDKRLLNGYFLKNAFDFVLHNNLWSYLFIKIHPYNKYVETETLNTFLKKAILIK